MAFDITKNMRGRLTNIYPSGVTDMTTLYARKLSQDRQTDTSTAGATSLNDGILYDGDDVQDEARNFLRDLTTV